MATNREMSAVPIPKNTSTILFMKYSLLFVAVGSCLGSFATLAQTAVTSLGALGSNDRLDWGQFGAEYSLVTPASNGTSVGGLNVNVAGGGDFTRVDQGSSWFGKFSTGEQLLWTAKTGPFTANGPLDLNFGSAIYGAGFQIEPDAFGAFSAQISVYGSSGSLGNFSFNGDSSESPSQFIGVLDAKKEITSIVVSLTSAPNGSSLNDFTVGTLRLNTVPEPSEYGAAAGLGLLTLAAFRRFRR